jgi:AraC family ethanolamine operon transcriptional activator
MVNADRMPHASERIPRYSATQTRDAETHVRCITGWHGLYEHVGRQPFSGEVTEVWLWPIQIFRERLDQPCIWRGSTWSGSRIFVSLTASPGKISCDGRDITPSAVTVFPRDVNNVFCSAPIDNFTIAAQDSALIEYAQKTLGRTIPRESLRRSLFVSDTDLVASFQRCVAEILEEVASQPALLKQEAYRNMLMERAMATLLGLIDAGSSAAEHLSFPSTRCYIVEKATQYIDARLADPLVMSDVCRAIRVSPRTLRYSFEEIVGASPSQYVLALRLERVRRRLLQANADSRIYCIAERYGFAHMGRFAQFYYDAFGERPSDTRARARQPNPARSRGSTCSA